MKIVNENQFNILAGLCIREGGPRLCLGGLLYAGRGAGEVGSCPLHFNHNLYHFNHNLHHCPVLISFFLLVPEPVFRPVRKLGRTVKGKSNGKKVSYFRPSCFKYKSQML